MTEVNETKFCINCKHFQNYSGIAVSKCKHPRSTRINPVYGSPYYFDAPGFRHVTCKGELFEQKDPTTKSGIQKFVDWLFKAE